MTEEQTTARIDNLQHSIETLLEMHMLQTERLVIAEKTIHLMGAGFEQIEAGCREAMEHAQRVAVHVQQQAEKSADMLEQNKRLTAAVDDFVTEMKKHIGDDPADFWKNDGKQD